MPDLKLEPGKSYETRDGSVVRVLCVDANAVTPVICLTGSGALLWLYPNGRQGCVRESSYDLIREHVPAKSWLVSVCVNANGDPICVVGNVVGAIGQFTLIRRGKDFDVEKIND